MAFKITDLTNTESPSSDYPYGKLKNNTGSNNGTPVNEQMMNDVLQFFQKLMDEGSVVSNGLPDNEYSGFQLYQALTGVYPVRQKVIEIGGWDMSSTMTVNVAHGLADTSKIRSVNATILSDAGILYPFDSASNSLSGSWAVDLSGANVELTRPSNGFFDQALFDDGAINRGFVTIGYVD